MKGLIEVNLNVVRHTSAIRSNWRELEWTTLIYMEKDIYKGRIPGIFLYP